MLAININIQNLALSNIKMQRVSVNMVTSWDYYISMDTKDSQELGLKQR